MQRPIYLDCNATTPVEPRVQRVVQQYFTEDFGNAGSRTHEYGALAKKAVDQARREVASVVSAEPAEVIFTSGATESNNLALLGLAEHGRQTGRMHIVSTAIEHKAVLEPLARLEGNGFDVDYVGPDASGAVSAEAMANAIRDDTLLVSMMHVNNETGVVQPIGEVAEKLQGHPAYLHTDAAQGFGKELELLRNARIDLVSISGHKLYAPKGVGALIARRRGYERPSLSPLMVGGGQERGLRPGTLPVHLIAGLGEAARIAIQDAERRHAACLAIREQLLSALEPFDVVMNGDPNQALCHVMNISINGLDSEAVMLALRDVVAISNGSACTSDSYAPSHVLLAMGKSQAEAETATRWSWCHLTPAVDCETVVSALNSLL